MAVDIPRPPKAVTFDCWSTLISDVSWDAVVERRVLALQSVAEGHGVDLTAEQAAELLEASWNEHVRLWREGAIFGAKGAAGWLAATLGLAATGPSERLVGELAEALENCTSEVGTRVVEGAPEALATLRDAGIPTALICDTGFTPAHHVRKFLAGHGLELDHYFFSEEVGAPKPFPPIFEAALAATGADPAQSVHIGDLRRTDVAGARALGMATVRFTGVHDDGWVGEESKGEEADAVLKDWSQLPELLGL